MLAFIGLGYGIDITLRGLTLVKKADEVYLDAYTVIATDIKDEVEKVIGREVKLASRPFLEEGGILEKAENKDIALLIMGDPFFATTHVILYHEALEKGIQVEVVNNASIFEGIGKIGLDMYRFGRIVSIAKWLPNYRPTSYVDFILKNLEANLHTLLLPEPAFGKPAEVIKQLAEHWQGKMVLCSRLGFSDELIIYGEMETLAVETKRPFCFIIPAELSPIEAEMIKRWQRY